MAAIEDERLYYDECCRTPEEFSKRLLYAMGRDPQPMKAEERQRLTWEAATERFLDVSELRGEEKTTRVSAAIDTLAFNLHNYLTGPCKKPSTPQWL